MQSQPPRSSESAPIGLRSAYLGGVLVLGISILLCAIVITKRNGASVPIAAVAAFIRTQLAFFAVPLLLWSLASLAVNTVMRRAFALLALITTLSFLVNLAVLLALDRPLTPARALYFLGEWEAILSFVTAGQVTAFVCAILICLFVRVAVRPWLIRLTAILSVGFLVLGLLPLKTSPLLEHYRFPIEDLLTDLASPLEGHERYPLAFVAKSLVARGAAASLDYPLNRNVIMVLVESLSATDSFAVSGLHNSTPRLDRIASRGMLFRNFFSNFNTTEGALVSAFQGLPPHLYPGASRFLFRSFELAPSFIQDLNRKGFTTAFLEATPLAFMNKGRYLRNIGFNRVSGREEVKRFRDAPTFTFSSPSDQVLFEEGISWVDELRSEKRPYFFSILTASSHRPFIDPLGGEDSETRVLDFVDIQLERFVGALDTRHFFDDGVLLILGDHRKMLPITEEEQRRYEGSAEMRVPLIALGSGIPKGVTDDRVLQMTDLLRFLDRIPTRTAPLTKYVTYSMYPGIFFDINQRDIPSHFVIVGSENPAKGYWGTASGTSIRWGERPPPASNEIEAAIHQQRAALQAMSEESGVCSETPYPRRLFPSLEKGVLLMNNLWGPFPESAPLNAFEEIGRQTNALDRISAVDAEAEAFLNIDAPGEYWFRMMFNGKACVSFDGDQREFIAGEGNEKFTRIMLQRGVYEFRLRFKGVASGSLDFQWKQPNSADWATIPAEKLTRPECAAVPRTDLVPVEN